MSVQESILFDVRSMLMSMYHGGRIDEFTYGYEEGNCLVIRITRGERSQKVRVNVNSIDDFSAVLRAIGSLREEFPEGTPRPRPKENFEKSYSGFKEALGEMCPEYQKERLKQN